MTSERHPGSFRDRAGYVVRAEGAIYRRITESGLRDYRHLMSSGLYAESIEARLLVSHREVDSIPAGPEGGIALLPDQIPAISYPYEWCFSQLKDAALVVLDLQELALSKGMSLKDATAYNIQFHEGRPVFIDTSSFELYREGEVWAAYRQFCEHFLTPLLLMSRVDPRFGRTLSGFLDGIPVELAASVVKRKTWLNPWLYMHVGLHAKSKKRKEGQGAGSKAGMPKSALLGLLRSLRQAVDAIKWTEPVTEWNDYSSSSSYDEAAARHKHALVAEYLSLIPERPRLVWDLGANAGEFSRIFSAQGILTVAWDGDGAAVEKNYRKVRDARETHLLPLVQDFANPSPSLGWLHQERMSLLDRGPADLAVGLALIHHLVIGNSVPLDGVATFFARAGKNVILEFVDPEDPRVQQLLSTRSDTHDYNQRAFEEAFSRRFEILRQDRIESSKRVLYLLRTKN